MTLRNNQSVPDGPQCGEGLRGFSNRHNLEWEILLGSAFCRIIACHHKRRLDQSINQEVLPIVILRCSLKLRKCDRSLWFDDVVGSLN